MKILCQVNGGILQHFIGVFGGPESNSGISFQFPVATFKMEVITRSLCMFLDMDPSRIQEIKAELRHLLATVGNLSEQSIIQGLSDIARLVNHNVALRIEAQYDTDESDEDGEVDDGESLGSVDTWSVESSDPGSLVDFIDDREFLEDDCNISSDDEEPAH